MPGSHPECFPDLRVPDCPHPTCCCKETGGRHLLGIAHNHGIFAPRQNAYCFAGGKLGRLIKHYQIKRRLVGVQILRHRKGAHQHTRAKFRQQSRNLFEQMADAHAAPTAADGTLQNAYLGTVGCCLGKVRNLGRQTAVDFGPGQFGEMGIQFLELADGLIEYTAANCRRTGSSSTTEIISAMETARCHTGAACSGCKPWHKASAAAPCPPPAQFRRSGSTHTSPLRCPGVPA